MLDTPSHRRGSAPALILALLAGLLVPFAASAEPEPAVRSLFARLDGFSLDPAQDVRVRPTRFTAYDVDVAALGDRLDAAPTARAAARGAATLRVRLPDPSGTLVAFDVVEDSILEPALAARHPEIRTYAGRAVADPTRTVRLDVTPMGLHASVRTPGTGRAWYVDPAYDARGTTEHLSYDRSALPARSTFVEQELAGLDSLSAAAPAAVAPGEQVALRTYRLAFATDPAYAAYFGSANVFAEKVTLMNRVNQIYLDDLAVRMVLVDGTDTLLNFDTVAKATGPDGPCGADPCYDAADLDPATGGCSSALLTSNEFALAQTIGADRYDIGHIGLGIDGGGIAGLGVVGESGKADGCTGLATPEGDVYAIDYVAHEMGHQFGANHTFNGVEGNCSLTNRNGGSVLDPGSTTAVEPGSGSSVMAYAGICGHDDLQPHTDPWFSQRSLDEITAHVTAEPSSYAESQTVTLRGFDADGESVTLGFGDQQVVVERGAATYNGIAVGAQMAQLTGQPLVTVGGYHADPLVLNDGGFYVDFPASAGNVPRITVLDTSDGVEASIAVDVDGGEGTNQGVASWTGNHAPAVTAPADRTVPTRTPFTLTGSGTDPDGDPLVYLWEQNDEGTPLPIGGIALTSNSKYDGPLFRVFGTRADVSPADALTYESPGENLADGSPSRTFPDLAQVLAGTTNAATGTCPDPPADPEVAVPLPVVDCYSEFLPTDEYAAGAMTFRLTARDLAPGGGGTQHDDTVLTVDRTAGPFLVTSRSTAGSPAVAGTSETVTWDVNGTDAADLAPRVRLRLSTDGGLSYPHVLVASTPNDGSADVVWPELTSGTARLKVEAVGNYFFDVNDATFRVVDRSTPATRITAGPRTGSVIAAAQVVIGLGADEPGASYSCRLDGRALPCGPRTVLRGLRSGGHVFSAVARDSSGHVDRTPAVRRFAVARDDRALTRATRGWRKVEDPSAFRGTLLRSTRPGQALSVKVRRARTLALVAPRGPRSGAVRVLAGRREVALVDLSAQRAQPRAVIVLERFSRRFTGVVRIETLGRAPVRIDGLGVYTG